MHSHLLHWKKSTIPYQQRPQRNTNTTQLEVVILEDFDVSLTQGTPNQSLQLKGILASPAQRQQNKHQSPEDEAIRRSTKI